MKRIILSNFGVQIVINYLLNCYTAYNPDDLAESMV